MRSLPAAIGFIVFVSCVAQGAGNDGSIAFKRHQLDAKFRSEGAGVGDFNHDGKLDIAAGSVYYAAPDWKMIPIRERAESYDPHNYSDSFANFAYDVNGDGRTDLVVVDFPNKPTWWFEQPESGSGPWKRHEATPVTNNESPQWAQLIGDDHPELVFAFEPGKYMAYASPLPAGPWRRQPISTGNAPGTDRYSHGLGVGDVNRDGRADVLVPEGWWEQPAARPNSRWKFHMASFGKPCAHMRVYDFDGDGDNDVLSSSAHDFGIWWHEQLPKGWQTHEIDRSFSQSHSLCVADINRDGLPDFVTGKRWWAHGPKENPGSDPGSDQPAVLFWFELKREGGHPSWTAHEIDHDSGIGTQFEVVDVNGDGLLDIATASKKGAYYFEQLPAK